MRAWVKRAFWFGLAGLILGFAWLGSKAYLVWQRCPSEFNLLVLGKGGGEHEAPDLTDTLLLVLFKKDRAIQLISLPRDLWVDKTKAKINASYYYDRQRGKGYDLTYASVKEVSGLEMDALVVVDFAVFEKVIDVLGGIEVEIKQAFSDPKYPIAGRENDGCNGDTTYACRYETLTFASGRQWMDGARALQFVRSRNAEGEEGNDLARSRRQQQVILAIISRLQSFQIWSDLEVWRQLWQLKAESVESDLSADEIQLLLGLWLRNPEVVQRALPQELLRVSNNDWRYDRQYVFLPKSGSWQELQAWFAGLWSNTPPN